RCSSFSPCRPCSPPPALLPYTTLFRSIAGFPLRVGTGEDPSRHGKTKERLRRLLAQDPHVEVAELAARFDAEPLGEHRAASSATDRKSTRLNSSHVSNSYAVFCVKKKR